MEKIVVKSNRLEIGSRTLEEMKAVYEREKDSEMKQAYKEMCELMSGLGEHQEMGCDWEICLKDGTSIGGVGFKGMPDSEGNVEIGYGIDEAFRRHGYATEAVEALTRWALAQPGVKCVQAQTDPENAISQKVLLANGFIRNGYGEEGPMFEKKKA